MTNSDGVAFCKGRFVPVGDACISVLDPAFTKSDVVFDAVSVWDGVFFRLDDHLRRYRESCRLVRMNPPLSDEEIKSILATCVDRAALARAIVYFLCTRGRYASGRITGDPRLCQNEFLAYAVPYYYSVPADRVSSGVHVWVTETRRAPDSAINQRVKNFNRMDLTRAQFEALDAEADVPVLLSTNGFLTEGPGFNLWLIVDGRALTPADNLLVGITRRTVFELCQTASIPAEAADLRRDDLERATEVFLSSTGGGIIPVTRVNGRLIGNGAPGLVSTRLGELYWELRSQGWHGERVSDILAKSVLPSLDTARAQIGQHS